MRLTSIPSQRLFNFRYLGMVIMILGGFVFGGCGITSRQAQIRQWVGRSESELIAEWGPPARTERDRQGRRVLIYQWETERWEEEEGRMWTDGSGVTHWTPPRSRKVSTVEVRRFVVDSNGQILSGSWSFY